MRPPSPEERELEVHRRWIGLLQPVGLVASPRALIDCGAVPERNVVELQEKLHKVVERSTSRGGAPVAYVPDLVRLLEQVLDWREEDLLGPGGAAPLPDALAVPLPDYGETLRPTHAARDPVDHSKVLLLIQVLPRGTPLDDAPAEESRTGWHASPHAKFERLLRKLGQPTGLLTSGEAMRLVHAPEHQTAGHLTFPVQAMTEVTGRPILAAFRMLLGAPTVFDLPDGKRLADILTTSRKYQNDVGNDLADQVLGALWELLQGFQKADARARTSGTPGAAPFLAAETAEDREHVYGALLTALMRMVFLLYAEDQGLLPADRVWVDNYSVAGLWTRLRDDAALHPDTMDDRFGAWATLLALFRIVHHGGGHGAVRLPARRGQLFDPDAYPFLEGRQRGSVHDRKARIEAPRVSDGCLYRVLQGLLVLGGERLSYRALDVEQIGSVYEAMMGYVVERLPGRSLAVRFSRKGVPGFLFFDVDELLGVPAKDRVKWLEAQTTCELTGKAAAALRDATTPDAVLAALDRRVSKRTPRVLGPGTLVLQPGEERRRSGSHYTPRELTKPIVETTLRPVLEALGPKPTPEQILDLKVCDPAMGSGAFLVEACRHLAEHLVEAWEHHGRTPVLPPDEDALLHAKRLIAQRCLYGVDKNPFAVNLAKLSLWLVTLARDHPFTFVDHALRHGDSLVGLTREQIVRFHWDVGAGKPMPLLDAAVRAESDVARSRRTEIGGLGDEGEDQKLAKLAAAEAATADARLAGDLVIAAFFSAEKDAARKARLAELRRDLDAVQEGRGDRAAMEAVAAGLRTGRHPVMPFHWEVEFPEVFFDGGFAAFVGNPPFLGGSRVSGAFGAAYLAWLLATHPESHGNSDLVAHFFRKAFALARSQGTLGLIATKTISKGDTRSTGLRWICTHGGEVFCAQRRADWPGLASVVVSIVHIIKGRQGLNSRAVLNGHSVERITAFLASRGGHDSPLQLAANVGSSFLGSTIYGRGFTFDDTDKSGLASPVSEIASLVGRNPKNQDRIFPLIGGEEVNESPTHANHRFVINFGQMSLAEAEQWPDLLAIVHERVKPERDRLREDTGPGAHAKKWWWQFQHPRQPLYAAIEGLQRVTVCCLVSNKVQFAIVPARMVFTHKLAVFPFDQYAPFCALQSNVHEVWARSFSSSMKDDINYSTSDVFETFPFPAGWRNHAALEAAGKVYCEFRAALMIRNDDGLTKTYNRFHDPDEPSGDIRRLRDLHDAMDRAVLDAYGWTDLNPKCEFLLDYEIDEEEWGRRKKPWRYRWPDDVRDEILGRLLELNRRRAEEERLSGAAAEPAVPTPATVRRLAKARRVAEMPEDGLPLKGDDGAER